MWYAKPSGAYTLTSTEGIANVNEMNSYFNSQGYTLESQSGVIGNAYGESGLNPWRWQMVGGVDTVNLSNGYGLFQYTPASGYINGATGVANYSPNMSTTSTTSGATPADGYAQCVVFATDLLGKWVGSCWRSYWDRNTYSSLWELHNQILNTYGNGTTLTMQQFSRITNIEMASFAFLACFEGPAVPDHQNRYTYALQVYDMLSSGPGPGPTPGPIFTGKKMPIWMALKKIH